MPLTGNVTLYACILAAKETKKASLYFDLGEARLRRWEIAET